MATLVLDATTKTIKAVMSGAATANNPEFTASYADNTASSLVEGANDGALNGTSAVTLVSAPAASTRRVIKWITIQNKDTAAATVTITYDTSGTGRQIAKVTLQPNDTWTTDGTFDSTGSLKQTFVYGTVSLTSQVSGVLPIANGGTNTSSTPTQGGAAYGTGTALAYTAAGTSGQVLTSNGTSAPTWQSVTSGMTSISFGSTGLTPATATGGAVTVAGTLATTNGGTGLTTIGTALQVLRVNAGATGLEYGTVSGTPGGSNTQIQFNNSSAFGGSANFTWDGTNVQIGATGALRFADTDSSNYVAFKAPGTISSNVTWTLPNTDGSSGQFLSTNGTGTLSWATGGGGGGASTILESKQTISSNYTISSGYNGMSVAPVTVATGVAVTVPGNAKWLIVNQSPPATVAASGGIMAAMIWG
jgi:hypothetical protein